MTPDRLDYFLMLASTAEPDTQGALRDAVIELVATVRRLQGQADTDPAPDMRSFLGSCADAPVRDEPTAKQAVLSGSLGAMFWESKEPTTDCRCYACLPKPVWHMVLCQTCGNKRCPHAANHENFCTNSNEPGQPGSRY
jgi:hypothetical protein